MSIYLEFIKVAFQERYAFRFNFFVSIFGSLLAIFIQMNIWSALLHEREAAASAITLQDMLSYVIISNLIGGLTGSGVAQKIGERVESGMIAADFLRPLHLIYYLWADDFGAKSFQFLFVTVPTCSFVGLVYGISFPSDSRMLLLFFISLWFSVIISFYIHYILGMFAFWLQTSWFIGWVLLAFNQLFSGSIVPLWFYPDWLYTISSFLPFRLIAFEPISIYLEKKTVAESLIIILHQSTWMLVLILLERWLWLRAQRKVTVNGG